ncbi:hypothetical protein ACU6LR_003157 [Salmonella enterica subsp. enterica serovar Anatum]
MTIYNCLFEPKKSAIKDGAVALAISIEAPNKKSLKVSSLANSGNTTRQTATTILSPKSGKTRRISLVRKLENLMNNLLRRTLLTGKNGSPTNQTPAFQVYQAVMKSSI